LATPTLTKAIAAAAAAAAAKPLPSRPSHSLGS
jgi:hypothetical protein